MSKKPKALEPDEQEEKKKEYYDMITALTGKHFKDGSETKNKNNHYNEKDCLVKQFF